MLDIKFIRENVEAVKKGARDKRNSTDIDALLKLDIDLRAATTQLENFLAERNRISKEIPKASIEEKEFLKQKVLGLKAESETLEKKVKDLKIDYDQLMLLVPAPARTDVPIGKDDSENVEVKKVGVIPTFDFTPLDHISICAKHKLVDFERGVKLAGSRSYVLTGMGARLEQAILRLCYDQLVLKGYQPMSVPVLVKDEAMVGTGYFPTGKDQAYYVEKDSLALVGTAEVSLTSFYSGEILKDAELPIRMMAWSSCFRREAGTYGKDTSGLYRVHQFQKIEQVIIAPASVEQSEKLHQEILQNAEDILQLLELPYRVVYVCTGDLGQGQVRKHDIETWMPSRQNYGETHSCSTFHDFQARRLKLRYKDSQNETRMCYTLNNTAIASPRTLIPLLECHQQMDGSIKIPKALREYLGGLEKIG